MIADKKYKCGCRLFSASIFPCVKHFVIIDDKFKVLEKNEIIYKNNRTGIFEFKLNNNQLNEIVKMLESEKIEGC